MLIHFGLSPDLAEEAVKDKNSHNLIIQGFVEKGNDLIILLTANYKTVIVPFNELKPSGLESPDFDSPSIIDNGLTLKLGNYEAPAYALIEEFSK